MFTAIGALIGAIIDIIVVVCIVGFIIMLPIWCVAKFISWLCHWDKGDES